MKTETSRRNMLAAGAAEPLDLGDIVDRLYEIEGLSSALEMASGAVSCREESRALGQLADALTRSIRALHDDLAAQHRADAEAHQLDALAERMGCKAEVTS